MIPIYDLRSLYCGSLTTVLTASTAKVVNNISGERKKASAGMSNEMV